MSLLLVEDHSSAAPIHYHHLTITDGEINHLLSVDGMDEIRVLVDYRGEDAIHKVGGITSIILNLHSLDDSVMNHCGVGVDLEWVAVCLGLLSVGSPSEMNQHRPGALHLFIRFPKLVEAEKSFADYNLSILGISESRTMGVAPKGRLQTGLADRFAFGFINC